MAVRVAGKGTVEPLAEGDRSRVTINLEFTGHGMVGKVLLPLAGQPGAQAGAKDQQRLKERLEGAALDWGRVRR